MIAPRPARSRTFRLESTELSDGCLKSSLHFDSDDAERTAEIDEEHVSARRKRFTRGLEIHDILTVNLQNKHIGGRADQRIQNPLPRS